jgi:hypothetical protein
MSHERLTLTVTEHFSGDFAGELLCIVTGAKFT